MYKELEYYRKGDAIIHCVETSLMQCKDPTPSNLIHGLLRYTPHLG